MIFIIYGLAIAIAQLCPQTSNISDYVFKNLPTATNEWDYSSVLNNNKFPNLATTTDTKMFDVSSTSLLPLQITLDVPAITNISVNYAVGPYNQYATSDLRLVSQGLNEIVSYQSVYFTIANTEHHFDHMIKHPYAELQITFIQEQMYGVCNIEPIYGILAIPIYSFTGQDAQNKAPYTIQLNLTASGTNITDFDLKTNIFGQLKSNMASYVSYQAPINVAPFGTATWWVMTTPLFMQQGALDKLLQQNAQKTLSRIKEGSINLVKGTFYYQGDDWIKIGDDTVQWAATWVASIIPCIFFALIVCIYGQYELSNIGRYRRPEPKPVGMETEALHQDEGIIDKQIA